MRQKGIRELKQGGSDNESRNDRYRIRLDTPRSIQPYHFKRIYPAQYELNEAILLKASRLCSVFTLFWS